MDHPQTTYVDVGDADVAYRVMGQGPPDVVHIAGRIGSLAAPGEVLVTTTVKDLVAGFRIGFVDRSEHELKGVPGFWRLDRAVP